MREYSFEEVIANIKEGETYKCTSDIYIIQTIHRNEIGLKINNYEPLERCGTNDIQRFVKIKTPVSFNDILHSDKRCRVEHELLSIEDYFYLRDILSYLSEHFNSELIRKIILEGKWYIEED